ncbi:hypothetical protein [Streptomyces albogriseolus]|uniref:hypothetical protein n=1 Tax=Streptomyces albogriseolus TaxID=1887 RepID=UPI003D707F0F
MSSTARRRVKALPRLAVIRLSRPEMTLDGGVRRSSARSAVAEAAAVDGAAAAGHRQAAGRHGGRLVGPHARAAARAFIACALACSDAAFEVWVRSNGTVDMERALDEAVAAVRAQAAGDI